MDDDPDLVRILSDKLEQAGYRVTSASDAWQEVVQAQSLKLDLVITDLQMPHFGTGVDAYHVLRKHPATREVPVIFLTGISPQDVQKMMEGLPADSKLRLLYKPPEWEDLMKAVQDLTGGPIQIAE